jgi:maltose alpha-D-glucosyltransferase/alpha-amylase
MLLAEANQMPADVRAYFGDGDECHMAYHFPVMPRLFMALHLEERDPVIEVMERTPEIPDSCQWALFLRNHDELTLEMVSDEEREYMYLAFSADPEAKLNVGIRRRLAPLLNNSRRRLELLTSLLLSFPGTPIIYYGDEIAMGDNTLLGDRNGVRTPMQWTGDRNAGFSRAPQERLYSPVIVNVEAEERDPASFLHWMRNMIKLRRLFRVFGRGTLEFLRPANRKILAYVRRHHGDVVLCVANLSRTSWICRPSPAGSPSRCWATRIFRALARLPTWSRSGPTASTGSSCAEHRRCAGLQELRCGECLHTHSRTTRGGAS